MGKCVDIQNNHACMLIIIINAYNLAQDTHVDHQQALRKGTQRFLNSKIGQNHYTHIALFKTCFPLIVWAKQVRVSQYC